MRVAVVGLGSAARTLHLPALAGIAGVEIVGGMDIDPARCEEAKAKFAIPVFSEFDEMVGKGKPDLIVIGTIPSSSPTQSLRRLRRDADTELTMPPRARRSTPAALEQPLGQIPGLPLLHPRSCRPAARR